MSQLVKPLLCASIFVLIASCAPIKIRDIESPKVIFIPAGEFIAGSNHQEREYAYDLDQQAYEHDKTRKRKWYENELPRNTLTTKAYKITSTPITNAQYAVFISATNHPAPFVSEEEWENYGLVHPYERAKGYLWKNKGYPVGKENHPVVLVSFEDAQAYADWLSFQTGNAWQLPSEIQWEKAARGTDGRTFPWGNEFEASRLNSHDKGLFSTTDVNSFPSGNSPFGLTDVAGQVFEWTSTQQNNGRQIVKGGSWDDKGCGVCRPAARHARPQNLKHILIGFRLTLTKE